MIIVIITVIIIMIIALIIVIIIKIITTTTATTATTTTKIIRINTSLPNMSKLIRSSCINIVFLIAYSTKEMLFNSLFELVDFLYCFLRNLEIYSKYKVSHMKDFFVRDWFLSVLVLLLLLKTYIFDYSLFFT